MISSLARYGLVAQLLALWVSTREPRELRDMRRLDGADTLVAYVVAAWPRLLAAAGSHRGGQESRSRRRYAHGVRAHSRQQQLLEQSLIQPCFRKDRPKKPRVDHRVRFRGSNEQMLKMSLDTLFPGFAGEDKEGSDPQVDEEDPSPCGKWATVDEFDTTSDIPL